MRMTSVLLLICFPFILASHTSSSVADDPATTDKPAGAVTLAQWHLFLRTDDGLVFTDGESTRTFVLDSKDEKRRFIAFSRLSEHLEAIESKASVVIIHAWHGDVVFVLRNDLRDFLLEFSSFERRKDINGKRIPNAVVPNPIPNPLFAIRSVKGVHNKSTFIDLKRKGLLHVPQSFIDEIPE